MWYNPILAISLILMLCTFWKLYILMRHILAWNEGIFFFFQITYFLLLLMLKKARPTFVQWNTLLFFYFLFYLRSKINDANFLHSPYFFTSLYDTSHPLNKINVIFLPLKHSNYICEGVLSTWPDPLPKFCL